MDNAQREQTQEGSPVGVDWKESCFQVREGIEMVKDVVQCMRENQCPVGEAAANITLAYRHLEDARMRIGKAVQALDGGESCYPR